MARLATAIFWIFAALLLAALIVPKLIGHQGMGPAPAQSDESELAGAINSFQLDCGRYPTIAEGFRALQVAPRSVAKKWHGPYMPGGIPLDPWGRAYIYLYPGANGPNSFSIICLGPSGQPGPDNIVDNE